MLRFGAEINSITVVVMPPFRKRERGGVNSTCLLWSGSVGLSRRNDENGRNDAGVLSVTTRALFESFCYLNESYTEVSISPHPHA